MLEPVSPSSVGCDPVRLQAAQDVVARFVDTGEIPGAVAAVVRRGRLVLYRAWGVAAQIPSPRPMHLETRFDIASLTKPVATSTAFLRLLESGAVSLDQPVCSVLPELQGPGKEAVSFRHLLAHSSGLPGWRPTYVFARGEDAVAQYVGGLPLAYPPGTDVQYSDLGFMLLGIAVARLAGKPLDRWVPEAVFGPCGMTGSAYGPVSGDVAATEDGNAYEMAMVARGGLLFDRWRSGIICGEAQDGNAFYTLDGISGNAGVFATAIDLATFGQMWVAGGKGARERVLSRQSVDLALRNHTPGLPIARGLGWLLHRSEAPRPAEWQVPDSSRSFFSRDMYGEVAASRPEGELFPPGAPGHTGFTGTSVWLDVPSELVVVLLTNRAHPFVRPAIAHLRPRFHNALLASFE